MRIVLATCHVQPDVFFKRCNDTHKLKVIKLQPSIKSQQQCNRCWLFSVVQLHPRERRAKNTVVCVEFKKQSKVQAISHIDCINRACNHIFKVFVNLQITDSGNEVFMSLMRATNQSSSFFWHVVFRVSVCCLLVTTTNFKLDRNQFKLRLDSSAEAFNRTVIAVVNKQVCVRVTVRSSSVES